MMQINHRRTVISLSERVLASWSSFSRSYFGSYETHFWVNVTEEVTAVPHLLSMALFLRFR